MKQTTTRTLLIALALGAGPVFAADKMGEMDMKNMDMGKQKMGDMKGMDMGKPAASTTLHKTVGVVKALDAKAGTVTFDHEPVQSLNWPAMKMTFGVKDKMLFDKLIMGKKVEFDFVQEGRAYVVTAVK